MKYGPLPSLLAAGVVAVLSGGPEGQPRGRDAKYILLRIHGPREHLDIPSYSYIKHCNPWSSLGKIPCPASPSSL